MLVKDYANVLQNLVKQSANCSQPITEQLSSDQAFDFLLDTDICKSVSKCRVPDVIFQCDELFELFLVEQSSPKRMRKLSQIVTNLISTVTRYVLDQSDINMSIAVGSKYTNRLSTVLSRVIEGSRDWSDDLVGAIMSMWSVVTNSQRCCLLKALVIKPEECTDDRLKLVEMVLKDMTSSDWKQVEDTGNITKNLLTIACREDRLCTAIGRHSADMFDCAMDGLFSDEVVSNCLHTFLRRCSQSKLSLVDSLSTVNSRCQQIVVDWFSTSQRWNKTDTISKYSQLIVNLLTRIKCKKFSTYHFIRVAIIG